MGEKDKLFYLVTREEGKRRKNAIDVSSKSNGPCKQFSPFSYSEKYHIPVPGKNDYANSVESIWQGLKVINGSAETSMFHSKPKKRKGNVNGHLFGNEIIDYLTAREEIYKPAYMDYLNNNIPRELKDDILGRALEERVGFYDIESNFNPKNDKKPLAHSYFVKEFFTNYLAERSSEVKDKINEAYKKSEFEHETLAEPLSRAIEIYKNLKPVEKKLAQRFLANGNAEDKFQKRFYKRLLEKIKS